MKAIKFMNGLGHEQILNLSIITSIEKPSAQSNLVLHIGKEHLHVILKDNTARNELFDRICKLLEVD